MEAAAIAEKKPRPNAYTSRPCPWCGDWPRDEDRSGKYCRPCERERKRLQVARRRSARMSQWFADLGTADSERAASLASAIVSELGGYDRAAKQLVTWLRESVASGKAPAASVKAIRGLMRMIDWSQPAADE